MNDESKVLPEEDAGEDTETSVSGPETLPRFNQLPSVKPTAARFVVENIISREDVAVAIDPYFKRRVRGHKMMDLTAVVDIVKEADRKQRQLAAYKLNDFELGNVIKNVIRSRFVLGKDWKIESVQPKVAAILAEKIDKTEKDKEKGDK